MKIYKLIFCLSIVLCSLAGEHKNWWDEDYYQNMKIEYFTFYSFLDFKDYKFVNKAISQNYGSNFAASAESGKIITSVRELNELRFKMLAEADKIGCSNAENTTKFLILEAYGDYLHISWISLLHEYFHEKYNKAERKLAELSKELAFLSSFPPRFVGAQPKIISNEADRANTDEVEVRPFKRAKLSQITE
ncbi:MAG: hypothetical protein P4L22_06660 [Candidatus Babeliales bacterium]|nr:hypothetical protein [Candidatus Babeliales bacterium]